MDIRGLGGQTLEKLLALDLIEDPSDLYFLNREEVAQLPNFKEKSVANLLEGIEQGKSQPFRRVLFALGIRHVGESIAALLATHFSDVDSLINASEEEISSIDGIGPEIARSVHDYFETKNSHRLIKKLKKAGLQFRVARGSVKDEGSLKGKTFVVSGTLPTFSRAQATEFIRSHGGKVTSSISSKTDFLVVGDSPGSKRQQARKLQIPQISEETLRTMVLGPDDA